jgi:hypothetical protein
MTRPLIHLAKYIPTTPSRGSVLAAAGFHKRKNHLQFLSYRSAGGSSGMAATSATLALNFVPPRFHGFTFFCFCRNFTVSYLCAGPAAAPPNVARPYPALPMLATGAPPAQCGALSRHNAASWH